MNTLKRELQQLIAKLFGVKPRIEKYNVAPRLGMRAVERRLRRRLPGLADAVHSTI